MENAVAAWLVYAKNVKIHVQEFAEQMLNAMLSAMLLYAFVSLAMLVIHLLVVILIL